MVFYLLLSELFTDVSLTAFTARLSLLVLPLLAYNEVRIKIKSVPNPNKLTRISIFCVRSAVICDYLRFLIFIH